ncbi:hypothetical protein ASF22_02495 [Methylobacterium sp. Leaf87]|uniref:hypothetical protein n=1 Tax=Methylobacterium sp. Leaf87 TaxID=1736243 RepID=UPI0006F936F7|nr:hypothetical protein [Methylobacterium sp. Leaf87]KQO69497.1 hypothetical protein ASF22_02495 [Methylobacterium sp. Leaf87]
MSLQIIFTTERGPDIGSSADQVAEALAAIGFIRRPENITLDTAPVVTPVLSNLSTDTVDKPSDQQPAYSAAAAEAETRPTADKPARERGKPSAGRKRRTAEEVAEDEAADARDNAAAGVPTIASMTTLPADSTPEQVAEAFANLKSGAAISTGEERVGPEDDAPEVQAQDAADEAAEAEGGKIQDMLTHDDLRKAMGDYVTRYGMPAAQIDGPTIFNAALGDVPAGAVEKDGTTPATAWRMTLVPDTQEALGKAVGAWREALAKNPWKRDAVGG